MYRFIRTVTVKLAVNMPAALQFCNEVASHLNKSYNLDMKTGVEMFAGTKVYWFSEARTLDEMSQLNAKLMQDRGYWEILEKAKHLWVEGSMRDTIVNIIN